MRWIGVVTLVDRSGERDEFFLLEAATAGEANTRIVESLKPALDTSRIKELKVSRRITDIGTP